MSERRSVLVVDDDPLMREIVGEMLETAGYACRKAVDGVDAIARLVEAAADLVVLDVLMPNKEGIETLREIRERWPATRVIMISAGARVMPAGSLLKAASALGADATAAKPLTAATFLPIVGAVMAGAPAAAQAR